MKFIHSFFYGVNTMIIFSGQNSAAIIKNGKFPACKNCIHYRPSIFSNDYTSTLSKCVNFGNKDILTDKISYDFADSCRNDEDRCGLEGKYFEKDTYIYTKMMIYTIIGNIPNISIVTICLFILSNYNRK
jgi:hypothetical protein